VREHRGGLLGLHTRKMRHCRARELCCAVLPRSWHGRTQALITPAPGGALLSKDFGVRGEKLIHRGVRLAVQCDTTALLDFIACTRRWLLQRRSPGCWCGLSNLTHHSRHFGWWEFICRHFVGKRDRSQGRARRRSSHVCHDHSLPSIGPIRLPAPVGQGGPGDPPAVPSSVQARIWAFSLLTGLDALGEGLILRPA